MLRWRTRRARFVFPFVFVLLVATLVSSAAGRASCAGDEISGKDLEALFGCTDLIRFGMRGDLVETLQAALSSVGYKADVDGFFGDETRSAVSQFQAAWGLREDGVVGPSTLGALLTDYYRKNLPESHTVRQGETLNGIADRYGLVTNRLVELNALSRPDLIYEGQAIRLVAWPDANSGEKPEASSPSPIMFRTEVAPLPHQRICLTFDDGPDICTTRSILTILKQYGVRATFFVIGINAEQHPDLVKEIDAAGHVLGVHGYEHKVLQSLSPALVRQDLKKAQDVLAAITGKTPWLYRPPFGMLDRVQVEEAAKLGMTTLMWTNIGGADLGAQSPAEVVSWVTGSAKDGGIIMLHEGLQHVVEALPGLIEGLSRLGFGFQHLSPTTALVPGR